MLTSSTKHGEIEMNEIERFVEILNNKAEKQGSFTRFYSRPGKKYTKILENRGGVHCFIDSNTLDVYKAASFSAPAKGIRYNLNTDMETLEKVADIYTGYLYR